MPNAMEIESAIKAALCVETTAVARLFIDPKRHRNTMCLVEGCGRLTYASSLCNAHYMRERAGRPLSPPIRARKRDDECTECGVKTGAKGGWGLCPKHYKKKRARAIKTAMVEVMGGRCSRCEGKFPLAVYDFHHLHSKIDSPGNLMNVASVRRISQELEKCILLCANCHRVEHNE